jgi:hypothetical protein
MNEATTLDLEKKLVVPKRFVIVTFVLMAIGLITFVFGFFSNPVKTWANLLMNNYYFLSLAIGATFFAALQSITQSGWSAGIIRVPQAIGNFIPVIAITMIPILLFGMHDLYHWTHAEAIEHDPLIAHKSPYLNIPFFIARYVIFFAVWTLLTQYIRRLSLKEDKEGTLTYFKKIEFFNKVYIFVLAVTFSLASFDYIMSIDVHWFSTIFAVRNFAMGFYHASAVIMMIVIILKKAGYLNFINESHLRDMAKYVFVLCIIWSYTWFSQYILIWYANIPEETVYYLPRTKGEFKPLFYGELILNWIIPFLLLMSGKVVRNMNALLIIGFILIIGNWLDVYQQVIVGTYGHLEIGFIEVGTFLGFWGLFAYVVARTMAAVPLVPQKHPYLEESLKHH